MNAPAFKLLRRFRDVCQQDGVPLIQEFRLQSTRLRVACQNGDTLKMKKRQWTFEQKLQIVMQGIKGDSGYLHSALNYKTSNRIKQKYWKINWRLSIRQLD